MLVDVPAVATEGIARSTEVHPVQVCAKIYKPLGIIVCRLGSNLTGSEDETCLLLRIYLANADIVGSN